MSLISKKPLLPAQDGLLWDLVFELGQKSTREGGLTLITKRAFPSYVLGKGFPTLCDKADTPSASKLPSHLGQ